MSNGSGEAAKIEHELAMLRERYAIYQRGAVWARWTLIMAGIVLAGLILWRLFLADIFGAVLVAIMCLIFAVWAVPYRKQRLVDLVSIRGDTREVEKLIAQREKRLAELRGRAS